MRGKRHLFSSNGKIALIINHLKKKVFLGKGERPRLPRSCKKGKGEDRGGGGEAFELSSPLRRLRPHKKGKQWSKLNNSQENTKLSEKPNTPHAEKAPRKKNHSTNRQKGKRKNNGGGGEKNMVFAGFLRRGGGLCASREGEKKLRRGGKTFLLSAVCEMNASRKKTVEKKREKSKSGGRGFPEKGDVEGGRKRGPS